MVTLYFDKLPNLNHGYIRAGNRRIKNPEAAKFQQIFYSEYMKERFKYRDFDANKKYFSLEIIWYNPKFFTKEKKMNQKAGDIDSILKFLLDGIFQGIAQDDAYLKEVLVRQLPSMSDKHVINTILSMNHITTSN